MVLATTAGCPSASDYAWVSSSYRDRWVDHVARRTFDFRYDGTGNWPFNTAYAARQVDDAFVTRLATLREAERFVHAGIPLVASISFGKGQLTGAPISATNGHLVVIVGFTADGQGRGQRPGGAGQRARYGASTTAASSSAPGSEVGRPRLRDPRRRPPAAGPRGSHQLVSLRLRS